MGGNSEFQRGNASVEKGQHSGGKNQRFACYSEAAKWQRKGQTENEKGGKEWREMERGKGGKSRGFGLLSCGVGLPTCSLQDEEPTSLDTVRLPGLGRTVRRTPLPAQRGGRFREKSMMRVKDLESHWVLCDHVPLTERGAENLRPAFQRCWLSLWTAKAFRSGRM